MKKTLVVAAMALLALPAAAWSNTVTPGKYIASITSVVPEFNGKTAQADVNVQGTDNVLKVKQADGTSEEWIWNDKILSQKEFDKRGNVVNQYTATNVGGKYVVNCKDKIRNDCDAGIDSRNYWTIRTQPDGLTYEVYGVSPEKKDDPTATIQKRHTLAFKATTATSKKTAGTTAPATQSKTK